MIQLQRSIVKCAATDSFVPVCVRDGSENLQVVLNIFCHPVAPAWDSVGTSGAVTAEDSEWVAEAGQEWNIWQEWSREKGRDIWSQVLAPWFRVMWQLIFSRSHLWPESQTANSKHQAVYTVPLKAYGELFLYAAVNVGDFQMLFSGPVPHLYLQGCFDNSFFCATWG